MIYNQGIWTLWNEKKLKEENNSGLLWSCAEVMRSAEFNLKHLFMLPYKTITDMVYSLSRDVHLGWEEFNEMPFYEILMILDAHTEFVEKQNSDGDSQNDMIAEQQARMESMYRQQQNQMPKFQQPQMPNFQMPSGFGT